MTPAQAVLYALESLDRFPFITVAGIAGPGDPFADPKTTLETFSLLRERCPSLIGCVSTNGMNLLEHVDRLIATGVGFVTVTVNAVDQAVGALVYDHVRWEGDLLTGEHGAKVLLDRQLAAIAALTKQGITVKVNTVVIPGLNDHHVDEIARTVAALGADRMNLIGLIPVKGTRLGTLRAPDPIFLARLRVAAGRHLKQMSHCARCRSDAVGLLGGCRTA
jgi:nitrogen fixation protein NifB